MLIPSTVRRRSPSASTLSKEACAGKHVPYSHQLDEHTIATKDGYLIQILRVDGVAFETTDQSRLNHLCNVRNTMWRALCDNRTAVWHHIIRRSIRPSPDGNFVGFCDALNRAWHDKLQAKKLYCNDQYISIVRRPRTGKLGLAQGIIRTLSQRADKAAYAREQSKSLAELNEITVNMLHTLAPYGIRRLGLRKTKNGTYSEPLEFLSHLISQQSQPIRPARIRLDHYLPTKRLFFGQESLVLRGASQTDEVFAAMLSIKEYDAESGPGMLDSVLRLPYPITLSQSYALTDRQDALADIDRYHRVMASTRDAAHSQRDALVAAKDATASGIIGWGEHHLTLLVKANDRDELENRIADVSAELAHFGIVATREDLGLELSYWAQLPGNFSYIARKALLNTVNFAGYASLHGFPSGQASANHWGPAVTTLETRSGTPYAFSFHVRDVGNFGLFGPTGTGKTVVLCFLLAQAQRFNPRCIFFDKDRGGEVFVRAIGGRYSRIREGHVTGFNPLQLPDTPYNRAFLRKWLAVLLRPVGTDEISAQDRSLIHNAVDTNFEVQPQLRQLRHLRQLFEGHARRGPDSIEARLSQWWGEGERAWMFDNDTDIVDLEHKTVGVDMTHILDDPIGRTPVLMYLFHRIDQVLDGNPTLIFIDEAPKALDNPFFAKYLKDFLMTIRKRNGAIGFGAQSLRAVLDSHIKDSLLEQCPTHIFMPNIKADTASYCGGFGLSTEEFKAIRSLSPSSRCFLIKQGSGSVVARLDLTGLDDMVAVLSGREETVAILDAVRDKYGDDPEIWLPHFHEQRLQQR